MCTVRDELLWLEVQPSSKLHLSLAIDGIAVRVEIRSVVLHKIQRPRRSTRSDRIRTAGDAGDVLVVHQIERFGKELKTKSVEMTSGKIEVFSHTKIHDCCLRHRYLVATQDIDAVSARA